MNFVDPETGENAFTQEASNSCRLPVLLRLKELGVDTRHRDNSGLCALQKNLSKYDCETLMAKIAAAKGPINKKIAEKNCPKIMTNAELA